MAPQAGAEQDPLSIARLYDEVTDLIDGAFPRSRALWVHGEVQKVYESSGHAYIDMIDPDDRAGRSAPVLKVKCWRSTWSPLKASLAADGLRLEAGMTVVMRGRLDFYKPRAEVGFVLEEVDVTALLGRLARERAELIAALEAEGLLRANAETALPEPALRIGLVGSPGTEGFRDFLGQLERTGLGFEVLVAKTSVQGATAPAEVAAAIALAARSGAELVCVVRGGGSKSDLAAFDAAEIARAIACCPVPVFTGIGHTGDESVADLVAHSRHITPTACGSAVASSALLWWQDVAERSAWIADQAERSLREAERELSRQRATVVVGPTRVLAGATASLAARRGRLVPATRAALEREAASLAARSRLLSAYDPARLLERGWSITTDEAGRPLRSVLGLERGAMIVTQLGDGRLRSTVAEVDGEEA